MIENVINISNQSKTNKSHLQKQRRPSLTKANLTNLSLFIDFHVSSESKNGVSWSFCLVFVCFSVSSFCFLSSFHAFPVTVSVDFLSAFVSFCWSRFFFSYKYLFFSPAAATCFSQLSAFPLVISFRLKLVVGNALWFRNVSVISKSWSRKRTSYHGVTVVLAASNVSSTSEGIPLDLFPLYPICIPLLRLVGSGSGIRIWSQVTLPAGAGEVTAKVSKVKSVKGEACGRPKSWRILAHDARSDTKRYEVTK